MDRRSLNFRSFDQVAADVDALAAGPYTRCGNWDLATTCDHLAKTFESGLDNKPVTFPFFIRMVAPIFGPLIFKRVLKTRRFPTGVSAPSGLVPDGACDCADAVVRLKAAMTRAADFQGPLSRHPIFGRATVDQWKDAMMIHCAHHLSFLCPSHAANEAAARQA